MKGHNNNMKVTFTVDGEPKGKQRPRVVHIGTGTTTYTPEQTKVYENWVRCCYLEQVGRRKLEAPIKATIVGVFPIPKSTPKKQIPKMLSGEILHTKKIDCDNLAKVILDSLNKIAYNDDSGISKLVVDKIYGEQPRVEVTLEEIR